MTNIFSNANKSMDSNVLEIIYGPKYTIEQYELLVSCSESPAARLFLLHFPKKLGRTYLGKTTTYIMSQLFTNSLMSKINMDRRRNLVKLPFRKFFICKVAVEFIIHNFPNTPLAQAYNANASYFKPHSG
ncbi:uncharacterized protein LOC136080991 [Hydra vulgaris]|uniref:Uncharacterized protein LOC136080991 n=1 Tax=Hydra vulgaris TaxID=6087 RepID=A0ABM4BYV0_HYDVU